MTSPAQVAANRRNASASTGPRSAEGKARSRLNALKHGLTAERATLAVEDRAAHERLRLDLAARFQPEGETEARLVDDLAFHYLRLSRLPLAEAGAWNAYWKAEDWPYAPFFGQTVDGLAHESIGFGVAIRHGVMAELVKLSLYEQRIRRALEKARAELAAVQAQRRAAEQAYLGARSPADEAAEAHELLDGLAAAAARREAEPPRPVKPAGTFGMAEPRRPGLEERHGGASEAPREAPPRGLKGQALDDWMLAKDCIPPAAQNPAAPEA